MKSQEIKNIQIFFFFFGTNKSKGPIIVETHKCKLNQDLTVLAFVIIPICAICGGDETLGICKPLMKLQ
jgi:hypothetical protein